MTKQETVPIYTVDNFDLKRLSFSHSKQKDSSYSRIYMNYDGKRFFFKTPSGRFPFGLSRSSDEMMEKYKMTNPSFTIQFTISEWSDEHEDTDMKKYYLLLKDLEESIMTYLTENAKDLGLVSKKGTALSRREIENQFTDFIKQTENKEEGGFYPPKITFKMKTYEGKFTNCPEVHLSKKQKVMIDYAEPEKAIPRNSQGFIVYSQCINLSNFGISLAMNPQLVKIKPITQAKVDFSGVLEDSDDESVDGAPNAAPSAAPTAAPEVESEVEEDESSETNTVESEATEESEEEATPEPVKPKTKRGRKKLATPE